MKLPTFLLLTSLEVSLLGHKAYCFNGFASCSTPVKKYTVNSSGNDSQECLDTVQSCANLEYILEELVRLECVVIELQDAQTLHRKHELHSTSNLAIVGNGIHNSSILISCKMNSGIYFESSQQVHLERLEFTGCTASYPPTQSDYYKLFVGLYFHKGANLSVSDCSFNNGVVLNDVVGEIRFRNTRFINKLTRAASVGLVIYRLNYYGLVNYIIDGCLFDGNDVRNLGRIPFGGGLTFMHNSTATSVLTILNTVFYNNHGIAGGGLHIHHGTTITTSFSNVTTSLSNVTVTISNGCRFEDNTAVREGGGVWVTSYNDSSCVTTVYITDTVFMNNTANWGGGLAAFAYSNANISVVAKDSQWIQNNAGTSGTGVAFYVNNGASHPKNNKNLNYNMTATFLNCSFLNNTNTGKFTSLTVVGSLYVGRVRINLINSTVVGNNGTALYIHLSAYATFSGKVTFRHNLGIRGSAIHVSYDSVLALEKDVHLSFINNTAAFETGGAIFAEMHFDSASFHTPCIFKSLRDLLKSADNFSVTFSNNLSHGKQQSVYISDPTNCFEAANNISSGCLLLNSKIFSYNPYNATQVASRANSIEIYTIPKLTGNTLEVMLGEHFYIDPVVLDIFGNPSTLHGNLVLVHDNQISDLKSGTSVTLVGPSYISMDSYTRNNPLYIAGTNHDLTRSVAFIYDNRDNGYRDGSIQFQVKLVDCKPGFLYNNSLQTCKCANSKNLVCPSSGVACILQDYWYGRTADMNYTVLPCRECVFDVRNYSHSGCANSPGFFPLNDIDDQCEKGRTGTLCSYCQANFSFTFSALHCVDSKGCRPGYFLVTIFCVVLYWIFFIFFVFMILSLNLRVGSGFMYGIVYYFSVIYMYTRNTIRDKYLATLVHTCVAITQLCPHIIGNLKMCFFDSWRKNLNHKIYHYITPVFVTGAIFSIIWLSRFCRCPKRLSLTQNSPVHAINILILFSYSSLTFVSFEILKPIKIYGKMMVDIDPDWKYFHNKHLPYALVAVSVELFVTLPVCFLLLFAPCLSRRLNLVKLKLKPIVDDFQACYRPQCRWFAGYYFLARQLVYLANVIPSLTTSVTPQDNTFFQLLNAVILIVHVVFQPYKHRWLNLLDTLLLSDILIVSFLHINEAFDIPKASFYLLIFFPTLYLLGVLVTLIARRVQLYVKPFCSKLKNIGVSEKMWINEDELYSRGLPTRSSVLVDSKKDDASANANPKVASAFIDSFYKDDGEREPLLSDSSISINSDGKEQDNTFTTTSLRLFSVARFPLSLSHRNSNKAATN